MVAAGIPFVTRGVPFVTRGVPLVTRGVPLVTRGVPFVYRGVPFVNRGVPFVYRGVPFVTRGIPLVTRGVPFVTRGVPFVTRGVLFVTRGVPFVTRGVPPSAAISYFSILELGEDLAESRAPISALPGRLAAPRHSLWEGGDRFSGFRRSFISLRESLANLRRRLPETNSAGPNRPKRRITRKLAVAGNYSSGRSKLLRSLVSILR